MNRKSRTLFIYLVLLAAVALTATGCLMLTEAAQRALGIELIGATPASNFAQNGAINFSVLGQQDGSNGQPSEQISVEVMNSDGTFTPCEFVGSDAKESSEFNSLALLIDDSGSMERTYPEDQFPGLCPTCPHDLQRRRAEASAELIKAVLQKARESHIAVMDFGPAVDPGWTDTRLLADFTSNEDTLLSSLNQIDGSLEAGTPLWDSLSEIVGATDEDADVYGGVLQAEGRKDSKGNDAAVKRFIVVLSDGDDRDSDTATLETVIAQAKSAGVVVHAIGLGPASAAFEDPRLQTDEQIETVRNLQKLAGETGGFYASVNDPAALQELYLRVAESLVSGYSVEAFTCKPDGEVPASGQKVTGRMTDADGNVSEWTMIAP